MQESPWWDRFEGRLAPVGAGIGIWIAAATATRPDWAPWWSGWALSIFGMAVTAFGLVRLTLMARRPSSRISDRAALGTLLEEGHRKYEDVKDLDAGSANADQRGEALRLWNERWEHRVETAFGSDVQGRAAFARDVDTSQMHYRRAPVHRLSVKLDRLQNYLDRQFTAEAVLVDPQPDENAVINSFNTLRDEIDTVWSIFGNTATWDSDAHGCRTKYAELIDRARALIRNHRPAYTRDVDAILRRPGRTSPIVHESADYRTSLELVRRLIDTILDAEKGIVRGASRGSGVARPRTRPMNTPIRVVGQPWESVGRPGFVEVLAVVPRRAPPAIGSTVSVLDHRYRVLGVSPAQDSSVHLDGTELLVRLDLEDEGDSA